MVVRAVVIVLILMVGACAGSSGPPRGLDNACSIVGERPSWLRSMKRTEARWGVPVEVQMATIWRESRFVSNARTPRRYFLGVIPRGRMSSAYGFAQAIDGTWDWYRDATGKRFARRSNFSDASDFIGWYMNQSRAKNGIRLDDAYNQYLAYHEGHSGYSRGSYRSKGFLLRAASEVREKARVYGRQLASCS